MAKKPLSSRHTNEYPKEIRSLADEVKQARLERGLSKKAAGKLLGIGQTSYIENNTKEKYSNELLHRVTKFLGYIPVTLKIDEDVLLGKFQIKRIQENLSLKEIQRQSNISPDLIRRLLKGKKMREEDLSRIEAWVKKT